MAIMCPHCGAENADGGAFCDKCGKALPSAAQAGPRIVTGEGMASTAAGQAVQMEHLKKKAARASIILIVVGVLIVLNGVRSMTPTDRRSESSETASEVQAEGIALMVLGVIFVGLGVWARTNPLPPAIVGLVLYVTLQVVQVVLLLAVLSKAESEAKGLVAGIIGAAMVIPVLIVIALASGVSAGLQHRRLQAQMRMEAGQLQPPGL